MVAGSWVAGLAAAEWPHGHAFGALFGHADEAIDEERHLIGVDEGVGRVRGAVGVPKREAGVVMLAGGKGVDLVIHAAVLAVDVVEERRAEREVIEGGVEDLLVGVVGGLYVDLRELGPPGGVGFRADFVEVPGIALGPEVFGTALGAGAGDADAGPG